MGALEKIPLSAVTVPLPSLPEPFQFAVADLFIILDLYARPYAAVQRGGLLNSSFFFQLRESLLRFVVFNNEIISAFADNYF